MKVFAFAIFVSAFLLFQVQPLMATFILPWFGGGPAVWTTCMLFFQVVLLAGYAYAYALTRCSPRRVQAGIHSALLLAALAFLPIVPAAHWKPEPDAADPTWRILLLLTSCLGLPYLALSATGPLLQAWFSKLQPARLPYRLYALSNVASLAALVSYPFVFEPLLTRQAQARLWAFGFAAFVLLCGACAWRRWRDGDAAPPPVAKRARSKVAASEVAPPTPMVRGLWFALSACGSVLLLATTNTLCQDVASIPFLWVAPLSLYLLAFALCFDRTAWYRRTSFTLLLALALALLCFMSSKPGGVSLALQISVYCGGLFVCCMVCHGEVYRLRPAPQHLTAFWLFCVSCGSFPTIFRSRAAEA